jgi:hypothetical protein
LDEFLKDLGKVQEFQELDDTFYEISSIKNPKP